MIKKFSTTSQVTDEQAYRQKRSGNSAEYAEDLICSLRNSLSRKVAEEAYIDDLYDKDKRLTTYTASVFVIKKGEIDLLHRLRARLKDLPGMKHGVDALNIVLGD